MIYVTLDWDDIEYDEIDNSYRVKSLVEYAVNDDNIREIRVRCSSCGHVHVIIYFKYEIGIFDTFKLRAHFRDDPHRIRLDLDRLFKNNNGRHNVIFDNKNGVDAGEWKTIYSSY